MGITKNDNNIMGNDMQLTPLWQPTPGQIAATNMEFFRHMVNKDCHENLSGYKSLYEWSIKKPDLFWSSVWKFCEVIGDMGKTILTPGPYKMPGTRFFPEARLNFAENLLRRQDQETAIIYWSEDQIKTRLTYKKLYEDIGVLVRAFLLHQLADALEQIEKK